MPSSAFVDLGVLCRAAGDVFSYYSAPNSSVLFANNTTIAYSNTVVDLSCEATGACGSTSYVFKNNIFLGYTQPLNAIPGGSGQAPGLFYFSDASDEVGLSSSYNVEYGVRNHGVQSVDDCATSGAAIVCADPLLVNEPAQGAIPPETPLDNFNFTLSSVSPAIGAGTSIPWLTTDYNGFPRPTPPSVGALEYGSVFTVAPPPSPPPPVTPPTSVTTATSVNVRVYPNPWRKDKHSGHPITFDQMAGGSDVKIFTASGHKVKELDGSSGSATWDLTNDSGNQVASGIYLYLIKDSQGNKSHGKLAIIQ